MVNFKTLLDKATNPDLREADLEAILEIVEEIKGKGITVKAAMKEIRKKLLDSNPTVVYHTLCVLDSVMKNCASDVHSEVLSNEFLAVMKEVITSPQGGKSVVAVDKALELIGEWNSAFGQQSGYKAVHDIFGELEREGFVIPEAQVASAAFIQKAPEWMLGDRCCICRQEFSRLKGYFRHHCRSCGKSVCTKCSANRIALPEYGIDQPTRACDLCYRKHDHGSSASTTDAKSSGADSNLPPEYLQSSLAHESQTPPSSSRADELRLQEEDDIQMAIAISLNEQENKAKTSKPAPSQAPPPQSSAPSAPPPSTLYSSLARETTSTPVTAATYTAPSAEQETDPNLARYLDRAYWEQRREKQEQGGRETTATDLGPQSVVVAEGVSATPLAVSVRKTVEMFIERMQQVSAAGGSVATDPVVLSMYQNLNAMQPQLLRQVDEVQQRKAHQEQILHKINEAKTARASLNTMRRQHLERIHQQEEEQSLLARMQMEQKLALLRQQKQEQFSYQQSLQQKRLEDFQSKRSEYERHLMVQREAERQQLIMQEQQVLQQQFGRVSPVPVQYGSSPGRAPPIQPLPPHQQYQAMTMEGMPMQNLSLQDSSMAPPLPTKLDHMVAPTPPPPYQPQPVQPDSYYQQQYYQPYAQDQPASLAPFQPHPSLSTTFPQQPDLAPPQAGLGGQPQFQAITQLPPPSLQVPPSSYAYTQPQSLPPSSMTSLQPSSLMGPQALPSLPAMQPHSMPSLAAPAQQPVVPGYSPSAMPTQPLPQHLPASYPQPPVASYPVQPAYTGQAGPQGSAMVPPPQQQPVLQRRESEPPLISFD